MKRKIGGSVILFNPDSNVMSNIKTYAACLDFLIIIDNSPNENPQFAVAFKDQIKNTIYQWLNRNEGIARALNVACVRAIENSCDYILTMDQDSFFEGDLQKFLADIGELETKYQNIGIISPCHQVFQQSKPVQHRRFTEISGTMTSGNLLNLNAYSKAGPFEEKLFIDYVDYEYCLRLRKCGFSIIQDNDIWIGHSLGEFRGRYFLGRMIGASNHNYIRRYYITRNSLFVIRKYFFFDIPFGLKVIKNLINDVARIIFFEKDKLLKLKSMCKGAYHTLINRFGEYDEKKKKDDSFSSQ